MSILIDPRKPPSRSGSSSSTAFTRRVLLWTRSSQLGVQRSQLRDSHDRLSGRIHRPFAGDYAVRALTGWTSDGVAAIWASSGSATSRRPSDFFWFDRNHVASTLGEIVTRRYLWFARPRSCSCSARADVYGRMVLRLSGAVEVPAPSGVRHRHLRRPATTYLLVKVDVRQPWCVRVIGALLMYRVVAITSGYAETWAPLVRASPQRRPTHRRKKFWSVELVIARIFERTTATTVQIGPTRRRTVCRHARRRPVLEPRVDDDACASAARTRRVIANRGAYVRSRSSECPRHASRYLHGIGAKGNASRCPRRPASSFSPALNPAPRPPCGRHRHYP